MSLSLSPELETLIRAKVAEGGYRDANELVADAISLLDERSGGLSDEVQRALDAGEADIREGRFTELTTAEQVEAFFKAP